MARQLAADDRAGETVRLLRPAVGESCPFCRGGTLKAMGETALMGIRRTEGSRLYPCIIMRCTGCGHLALFDSRFVLDQATARELSEAEGRWADEGGRNSSGNAPNGTA